MAKLAVNVDHVATLRQARGVDFPNPVTAAKIALGEGVAGITVHLREDRRHIQDEDVRRLRALENCKLNLEMAASDEIIEIALDIGPDQITLVPEKREELTTEGGLDVVSRVDFFKELSKKFAGRGITVSLFIDPDPPQIEAASQTMAEAVEINTGRFCESKTEKDKMKALRQIKEAVGLAKGYGLTVHAGHGLTTQNVSEIASIAGIDELNIGHSIVSQSVFLGFGRAVSLMKQLIERAARHARRHEEEEE
ncbi:MAG: pyridoxine 5'-phosphate synthase [Nitrospinota bacterium]